MCPPDAWDSGLGAAVVVGEGLPLGLQVAGFAGQDAKLFAVAVAIRDPLDEAR
jgi:Asp-tRNA(Asn)/Glu-tRNA(Gln) amidotransferase A subunit family amidase